MPVLICYIVIAVVWFIIGTLVAASNKFDEEDDESAKMWARFTLWFPIWPVAVALFIKNTAFPKER